MCSAGLLKTDVQAFSSGTEVRAAAFSGLVALSQALQLARPFVYTWQQPAAQARKALCMKDISCLLGCPSPLSCEGFGSLAEDSSTLAANAILGLLLLWLNLSSPGHVSGLFSVVQEAQAARRVTSRKCCTNMKRLG